MANIVYIQLIFVLLTDILAIVLTVFLGVDSIAIVVSPISACHTIIILGFVKLVYLDTHLV